MVPSAKKQADKRKIQFANLILENTTYPLATVTYHGPNPEQATKILVGILKAKNQEPIIKSWAGDNIAEDISAAKEITIYMQEHAVARVLTSEWVLSCPHQEGKDFPEGKICPYCPDWH